MIRIYVCYKPVRENTVIEDKNKDICNYRRAAKPKPEDDISNIRSKLHLTFHIFPERQRQPLAFSCAAVHGYTSLQ